MKYRPEIDGLRAIAVVPVILFHAGSQMFSGGYVGVDVFFVISGYLITTIIFSEIRAGQFTIAGFYERRARRILPALFFVMLVMLPFAWRWMLPSQLAELARGVTAVALFCSNILFWKDTDYFAPDAELNPLLHTWSLAVEEQYYLFFPLLLLGLWRFGRRSTVMALTLIGLISFALAQWGVTAYPRASFFLLPTRLWELLIGSLIAFRLLNEELEVGTESAGNRVRWLRETFAVFGALLIGIAVFAFDDTTPFPSAWTLVPTVGTGLIIIFATSDTRMGKLLQNRLLVGIGLISYSAYLWHQPVFVFARIRSIQEPAFNLMLGLGLASIGLAWLTWRLVEKPFRDRSKFSRGQVFRIAGGSIAIMVVISTGGAALDAVNNRRSPSGELLADLRLDHRLRPNQGMGLNCGPNAKNLCTTTSDREILLWGDSLAMHLLPALQASNSKARVVQMTKTVCAPILGIAPIRSGLSAQWATQCIAFNDAVFDWLTNHSGIRYVVLGSPFERYIAPSTRLKTRNGEVDGSVAEVRKYFLATLSALSNAGIMPVVIAPPPVDGTNIGMCLAKATMFAGDLSLCDLKVDEWRRDQSEVLALLDEVDNYYRVIYPSEVLCSELVCRASLDGRFIYRDGRHYSHEGAILVGRHLDLYERVVAP